MKKPIRILIGAVLLCLIGIISLYLKQIWTKNPNELTLYGNIEIRQVDLGFRVGGRIKQMFFEEGDEVKPGELLAILDDEPYQAANEKNKAQIGVSRASYLDALSKYERNLPLCKEDTVSKQECTTLLNKKEETKSALESAIASQKESQVDLKDTRIYSPSLGIITTRIQEPGAIVTGSQAIYTLTKSKPVWVRAFVPETNLANIRYGMQARVLTDTVDPKTGKKREYTGYVGYISPVAEFTPKTVQTTDLRTDLVYRIRVYIYELDAYLRQGMPTTILIDLSSDNRDEVASDEVKNKNVE